MQTQSMAKTQFKLMDTPKRILNQATLFCRHKNTHSKLGYGAENESRFGRYTNKNYEMDNYQSKVKGLRMVNSSQRDIPLGKTPPITSMCVNSTYQRGMTAEGGSRRKPKGMI